MRSLLYNKYDKLRIMIPREIFKKHMKIINPNLHTSPAEQAIVNELFNDIANWLTYADDPHKEVQDKYIIIKRKQ